MLYALLVLGCGGSAGGSVPASTAASTNCANQDVLWTREYATLNAARAQLSTLGMAPELNPNAQTTIVVYEGDIPVGVAGGPIRTGNEAAPHHRAICISQSGSANYYVDVNVPDQAP